MIAEYITVTIRALEANGFTVEFIENIEKAKTRVLEIIPQSASVGVGDSATIRQIGFLELLTNRGQQLFHPLSKQMLQIHKWGDDEHKKVMLDALRSDIFVTGTNVITQNGKLFNTDATGNRIVGLIFGPKKTIVFASINKIVKDLEQAFNRMQNIVAPYHCKTKQKNRSIVAPCVLTGKCVQCHSSARFCRSTLITEMKPARLEVTIIIINEDLGLGWDESWSKMRIKKIQKAYEEASWPEYYLTHDI